MFLTHPHSKEFIKRTDKVLKLLKQNQEAQLTEREHSSMSRPQMVMVSWPGMCECGCGDDGDAPVSCHGVRTWAGPGPRLSVVTRTRGRSHPHTAHYTAHTLDTPGSLVLWQVSVSTSTCHEDRGDSEHVKECGRGGCETVIMAMYGCWGIHIYVLCRPDHPTLIEY